MSKTIKIQKLSIFNDSETLYYVMNTHIQKLHVVQLFKPCVRLKLLEKNSYIYSVNHYDVMRMKLP